jgi:hypothetical protein
MFTVHAYRPILDLAHWAFWCKRQLSDSATSTVAVAESNRQEGELNYLANAPLIKNVFRRLIFISSSLYVSTEINAQENSRGNTEAEARWMCNYKRTDNSVSHGFERNKRRCLFSESARGKINK